MGLRKKPVRLSCGCRFHQDSGFWWLPQSVLEKPESLEEREGARKYKNRNLGWGLLKMTFICKCGRWGGAGGDAEDGGMK